MSNAISSIEIKRKFIHLSSLWIPAVIYYLEKQDALILFSLLTALVLLAEKLRSVFGGFGDCFKTVFKGVLRADEHANSRLTGAAYMMMGVLFCLAFPTDIAVTALSVLMVSDTAAAWAGQKYGTIFMNDKSAEGCAAFLASGLIVVLIIGFSMQHEAHYFLGGCLAVALATVAEFYSRQMKVDDNFMIPFVICIVMWLFQ